MYLSSKEVCERYKITKRTLNRWENHKNPPFPKPAFPVTKGATKLYRIQDIENWEQALSYSA